MRQHAVLVAVAAFLSLTAIPLQVLAINEPRTCVDIRYDTPAGIEGAFTAIIRFVPRRPDWHFASRDVRSHEFEHKNLEYEYASQLAHCYINQGTWARCHYPTPVTPTECYCESWKHWALPVGKTGPLYDTLLRMLEARDTIGKPLVSYLPRRPDGTDATVAATIYLAGKSPQIYVYDSRLARTLLLGYGHNYKSANGWFLNPSSIPPQSMPSGEVIET